MNLQKKIRQKLSSFILFNNFVFVGKSNHLDIKEITASGCHSSLWPGVTTFEKSHRVY